MHVVGNRCFARHVYDFVSSSVEHSCLLLLCVVRVLGADNRQDLDIMRVTHVRFLIACLMQKIFKSFVPVSLPELSHWVTCSTRNNIFTFYFEPKNRSAIASLVCQSEFEDLDSLSDCIKDLFTRKLKSLDALFVVKKLKVDWWVLQIFGPDWVNNPVNAVDISVKVIVLGDFHTCRADLVGKTLVDVLYLSAILLDDCLGVCPLNARRQVEDHWNYAKDW